MLFNICPFLKSAHYLINSEILSLFFFLPNPQNLALGLNLNLLMVPLFMQIELAQFYSYTHTLFHSLSSGVMLSRNPHPKYCMKSCRYCNHYLVIKIMSNWKLLNSSKNNPIFDIFAHSNLYNSTDILQPDPPQSIETVPSQP